MTRVDNLKKWKLICRIHEELKTTITKTTISFQKPDI